MGKKLKKAQIVRTIHIGDKSSTVSVNMFGNGQHIDYTGFGYHESDKQRADNRRNRRLEEKRVQMGDYD